VKFGKLVDNKRAYRLYTKYFL